MKIVPAPYAHQIEAFEFSKPLDYSALTMEQGTGKSKVSLMKADYLIKEEKIDSVIILNPNATKRQWINEQVKTHYPSDNYTCHIWQGMTTKTEKREFKEKLNSPSPFFFSVNYDAFQSKKIEKYIKNFLELRNPFVIADESTRIKNGRRKVNKRKGAVSTNKILDLFADIKYKCIMSGTPTPNSPFDLWAQYEFLKKDYFGLDFWYFKHKYGILMQKKREKGSTYTDVIDPINFEKIKNRLKKEKLTPQIARNFALYYGMDVKDIILINSLSEYTKYKNQDELKRKQAKVTFFKKLDDCVDLPGKIYMKLMCKMGITQKKLYNDFKKDYFVRYKGKELTAKSALVAALRMQMISGGLFPCQEEEIKIDKKGNSYIDTTTTYERIKDNGKVKVLLQDLEEVSPDIFIIVWARFRGEIDNLEDKIKAAGYSCAKYYGGSSDDVIDNFKARKFRILIANPDKAGIGLNLQHSCLMYFYSNSFKADTRLQAISRQYRISQKNKVVIKDLMNENTIDTHIYNNLQTKENMIDFFRTDITNITC